MTELLILGAGGHAKVVLEIASLLTRVKSLKLFDDSYQTNVHKKVLNYVVEGDSECLVKLAQSEGKKQFIIAIGNNLIRAKKYLCFFENEIEPFKGLFHPASIIAESAMIGHATVVMAGSIINANTEIGCNSIINTGSIIEHDNVIDDHVHIAPHATLCGNVSVGPLSWVGAGATVIEGVTIGKNCLIAAGSVVTKSVPDNSMMAGVPAKLIKRREYISL